MKEKKTLPWIVKWDLSGSALLWCIQQMLNRTQTGEFGGQVSSLTDFVMFLKPFLSSYCSVAGHIILVGSAIDKGWLHWSATLCTWEVQHCPTLLILLPKICFVFLVYQIREMLTLTIRELNKRHTKNFGMSFKKPGDLFPKTCLREFRLNSEELRLS